MVSGSLRLTDDFGIATISRHPEGALAGDRRHAAWPLQMSGYRFQKVDEGHTHPDRGIELTYWRESRLRVRAFGALSPPFTLTNANDNEGVPSAQSLIEACRRGTFDRSA